MKLFLKVLLLSKNHFKPISEKRLCKKHLPFIKRIFKFCPASMTMEAAVVLPLFFFFFLDLTSSIEMIRLHGNFQMALWDVGNTISVYGALGKEIQEEYLHDVDIAPVSAGCPCSRNDGGRRK